MKLFKSSGKHREAWEAREVLARAQVRQFVPVDDYMIRRRWENAQKHEGSLPSVNEVINASVGGAGEEMTIRLRFVGGEEVTLWVAHGGKVRSISPY